MKSLETVIIAGSVRDISDNAFDRCYSLKMVIMEEGVETIGENAFANCPLLTTVIIPESVDRISGTSFRGESYKSTWLRYMRQHSDNSLVIVNDILIDGVEAYGDIYLPDNVTEVADNAFYDSNITKFYINDNLKTVGKYAFFGCSRLTRAELPENIESLPDYIFRGCGSLEWIDIPETVTSIGYSAFSSCTSLESLKLPKGLKSIGRFAFSNCSSIGNISTLTLPDTLEYIGEFAFMKCPIDRLIIPDELEFLRNSNEKILGYNYQTEAVIVCSHGSAGEAYAAAQVYSYVVSDNGEHTPEYTGYETPSTCLAHGSIKHVCTVCGFEYTEELPLGGHSYQAARTVAPTETSDGYTEYVCTVCGDSYKDNFVPYTPDTPKTVIDDIVVLDIKPIARPTSNDVTVTVNGKVLEEGVDYTVDISYAPSENTAMITITGIGEYTGSYYQVVSYVPPEDTPKVTVRGDITGDGKVDTKDALKAVAFAKKTATPKNDVEFGSADVNSDGKLDSKDAMLIIGAAKKLIKL